MGADAGGGGQKEDLPSSPSPYSPPARGGEILG
jgi:hypothetical protein